MLFRSLHLRGVGAPVRDVNADRVTPLGAGSLGESVAAVLGFLGLSEHPAVAERVEALAGELLTLAG